MPITDAELALFKLCKDFLIFHYLIPLPQQTCNVIMISQMNKARAFTTAVVRIHYHNWQLKEAISLFTSH